MIVAIYVSLCPQKTPVFPTHGLVQLGSRFPRYCTALYTRPSVGRVVESSLFANARYASEESLSTIKQKKRERDPFYPSSVLQHSPRSSDAFSFDTYPEPSHSQAPAKKTQQTRFQTHFQLHSFLQQTNEQTNKRTNKYESRSNAPRYDVRRNSQSHSPEREFSSVFAQHRSQVARHCDRTFPPDLAQAEDAPAAAAKIRKKYIVLRRSNERKLLASQLELKMRALYYDVIDPTAVEGYIASIYKQVGDFVYYLPEKRGGGAWDDPMWYPTDNIYVKYTLL